MPVENVEMALRELQGWIPDALFIGIGQIQAWCCLFLFCFYTFLFNF